MKINLFLTKESSRCFNNGGDLFGRPISKAENPLFYFFPVSPALTKLHKLGQFV